MKSTLMQLDSKAESFPTSQSRVALLDVAMSLVTRVLGIEAMGDEDRKMYLDSVRSTGGSLLGCLGKQILESGEFQVEPPVVFIIPVCECREIGGCL